MNYTRTDLVENGFELYSWHGEPMDVLAWNNDQAAEPSKYKLLGVRPGNDAPWIVEVYYQDGTDQAYKQRIAKIPEDWTPYVAPKRIPLFDCVVGQRYRVKGVCGMDFDRIMYCVQADPQKGYLFGDTMKDGKLLGDRWINEVYTCEKSFK